jgi:WD40 repeat protein
VRLVAFTPDGSRAILTYGGCIQVWDVESGQERPAFGCPGVDSPTRQALALGPEGRTLLTGSTQGTLQLWNLATGDELLRLMGHTAGVSNLVYAADGRAAISVASDGSVRLWDLHSGAELVQVEGASASAELISPAFLPDGRTVLAAMRDPALGAADSRLAVVDSETGQIARVFDGQVGPVSTLAVTPDGRLALSGGEDGSVIVWDVVAGQIARQLAGHQGPVRVVTISPDGQVGYSASGSNPALDALDDEVIRWDLESGQELARWTLGADETRAMALGPDGGLLVGGANSLMLLDAETGVEVRRFPVGTDESGAIVVNAVAFSPDGSTALTALSNALLTLWDVSTGTPLRSFAGHTDAVLSVAFSPDGRLALSGSADQTVILWNVASGQPMRRYMGHADRVSGVAFSPDGGRAASTSWDHTLRIWSISDDLRALIDWAYSNRHVRTLTPEERRLYGAEPVNLGDVRP